MKKLRIGSVALFCILMMSMVATAETNENMLWEGVVTNNEAATLYYNTVSADYTWTLNEDTLGNPADVTYGDLVDATGRCALGYATGTVVATISVTIRTDEGQSPGVLNYIGDLNYSIRLAHTDDTAILNIESGNTLLVNKLYKYRNAELAQSPTPDQAIVNINNGHVFSYGIPDPIVERTMHGITVNIATGSSLRLMASIANVYDQATYAAYTTSTTATGADGYAGSVNGQPGTMLVFSDGGDYLGNPTVLITGVVGGPAVDPATPADTILNAGETAVFTVSAINPVTGDTTGLDYNWYEYVDGGAGDILVGTNSPTLSLPGVDLSYDGKRYYCKVINIHASTDSRQAYLTVRRKVAHWQFEDNMVDIVAGWTGEFVDPNVLHPTPTAVYDPAGISGKAFQFAGDGTQIRIINSNDGSFDFYPYGLTVSCWLKTTEAQTDYGYPVLFGNPSGIGGDPDTRGWYFVVPTDNTCGGRVSGSGSTIYSEPLLADGQWHMFTLTHVDGASAVYADGELVDSLIDTTPDYDLSDSLLLMGAMLTGERSYKGSVDDVQIYNYPLDAYQVATLYTNLKPGETICPEPVAYDLNGDCIVNLIDFSFIAGAWLDCNEVPTCTTSNP